MFQLNDHLFRVGISKTKGYLCGNETESSQHFLLDCFLYQPEREDLLLYLKTTRYVLSRPLNTYSRESLVDILLNGENNLERDRYSFNRLLFRAVQKFLVKTGRLRYRSILQLREGFTKKSCCYFGFFFLGGGGGCPNFMSPFPKCIFGQ